jgi:hypothetical protein
MPSAGSPGWPGAPVPADFDVLVPQAETLGAIAVIRSLGRAGFRVHAVSSEPTALGLRSRYAARSAVTKSYGAGYAAWARDYVRTHRIRAIIPSEGFLLALEPGDDHLRSLVPFEAGPDLTRLALSKHDLLARLIARDAPNLPPTLLIRMPDLPSAEALEAMGLPLFVKTDGCHALDGSRGTTARADTAADALEKLGALRGRFAHAVVQGNVPGQGVGAFFLVGGGKTLAEFMHLRLHEVPFTGGVSSLRASFRHEAILADAREKLAATGWQGVAMMEYRWDPATDRFWFVEMNARFWGSLHLALFAGVDFPRLLLDAWRGVPLPSALSYGRVACVHLPLEVNHVWSIWKSSRISRATKVMAVLRLCVLTFTPAVKKDLLFPGDRMLFWRSLPLFFRELLQRRASAAVVGVPPHSPRVNAA